MQGQSSSNTWCQEILKTQILFPFFPVVIERNIVYAAVQNPDTDDIHDKGKELIWVRIGWWSGASFSHRYGTELTVEDGRVGVFANEIENTRASIPGSHPSSWFPIKGDGENS